jgi:hypothetical protein
MTSNPQVDEYPNKNHGITITNIYKRIYLYVHTAVKWLGQWLIENTLGAILKKNLITAKEYCIDACGLSSIQTSIGPYILMLSL